MELLGEHLHRVPLPRLHHGHRGAGPRTRQPSVGVMSVYRDIIEVQRRRDASAAGDTELVALYDIGKSRDPKIG